VRFRKILYRATHWETWHYLGKYIPLAPAWLWYCLKARSLWFFTASNPTLTFGGFEGERKREMYDQLPPGSFPDTIYIHHKLTFKEVERLVVDNNFQYPFIVKPDAGMMGLMFRKIESIEQLRAYHSTMPTDYLVQKFVDYPIEVSVFYYRFPGQRKGTITGFIRKEYLAVTGDGMSTLSQLIENSPRASLRKEELSLKHQDRLEEVIPAGETYCLSPALNLSRGGRLVSLEHEKDDNLLNVFDSISHYAGHFYYGRYDVKCASIEDLKRGRNFSILEYNGSGAEPHHIYGNGYNLLQAYKIVLHHWDVLYQISKHNHNNGIPYWTYQKGKNFLKQSKKHFRLLKQLDLQTSL
jgi:hypothetical protein